MSAVTTKPAVDFVELAEVGARAITEATSNLYDSVATGVEFTDLLGKIIMASNFVSNLVFDVGRQLVFDQDDFDDEETVALECVIRAWLRWAVIMANSVDEREDLSPVSCAWWIDQRDRAARVMS